MLYYCQCLIDYEMQSLNENFLNNEKFWEVAEKIQAVESDLRSKLLCLIL